MDRYQRNMNAITPEENMSLKYFHVTVVGCGGLGGYIIEMLARLGIGTLTVIDGDVFDETNLNRQLLSSEENIGKPKAQVAFERISRVNSLVRVHPIHDLLTEENGLPFVSGRDLVFDALDNVGSRLALENLCEEAGVPLVHGAIAGWYGQVCVVLPGDRTLHSILPEGLDKGIETELGNPAFTPALVASMEVAEGIKVLLGREGILRDKLLTIDLLNQEYEILELK
jgi:molybdopterin/thiamine biosynthesis adenylyltransferase